MLFRPSQVLTANNFVQIHYLPSTVWDTVDQQAQPTITYCIFTVYISTVSAHFKST